jgi:serine/threonine protein kinase
VSEPPIRDPASSADQVRKLFKNVIALRDNISEPELVDRLRELCPTLDSWRRLISAIPIGKLSFQLEVGIQRAEAVRLLSSWCRSFIAEDLDREVAEIHGFLAVLLITLITMEEGPASSTGSHNDALDSKFGDVAGKRVVSRHNCEEICRALTRIPSVRSALLDLYAPTDSTHVSLSSVDPDKKNAIDRWKCLQEDSLDFHCHGSTSFILRGLPDWPTRGRIKFALKCVLLPYSTIPVIASKTESYTTDHDSLDDEGSAVRHMAQVWASTTQWILMDFVEGVTLSEEIERLKRNLSRSYRGRRGQRVPLEGNVRLDLIRILGLPLLGALAELHRAGKRHDDLSPTNIIVRCRTDEDGRFEYDVTFIDFGRNYLHMQVIAGHEGPDTTFVAPEVRGNDDDLTSADLYSLGRILIALGDVGDNRDGTIPDRFYGQAPLIARVIEDLIDEKPQRRLLIFGNLSKAGDIYGCLQKILKQELDVTQAELEPDSGLRERAVPYENESLGSSLKSLFPLSRESQKRRRIYKVRKEQSVLSEPRRSMHARWLLVFSALAAFNYLITTFVCISWFWRDVGIDILSPPIQVVLRLMGVDSSGVPIIDGLRQSDYRLGLLAENFPARMVGLSFALAGARYYQNIFSGLTTRVARSPALNGAISRFVTEVTMRTMAVWSSWLILAANLVQVRWWGLATAVGYTGVLMANVTSARFATKYLIMARENGLSTVPPRHQTITGLDGYRQWGQSMFIYSIAVWVFAVLIYAGVLKDVYVYAAIVAIVNVGLFYVIKTGANALDIRTGLNRCFLAAERLRYEKEQGVSRVVSEHEPIVPVAVDELLSEGGNITRRVPAPPSTR